MPASTCPDITHNLFITGIYIDLVLICPDYDGIFTLSHHYLSLFKICCPMNYHLSPPPLLSKLVKVHLSPPRKRLIY